jgi:hypothetical protein
MMNKAKNCPSAVEGAATVFAAADGKLVVTIKSEDEAKVTDARTRAAHLAKAQEADSATVKHTGSGTGGGGVGLCPVLLVDTTLAVKDIDGGVEITLTPKDPSKLEELKAAGENRLAQLLQKMSGKSVHTGHGHGSGKGGGGSKGEGGNKGPDKEKAAGDDGAGAAKAPATKEPAKKKAVESGSGGW